MYRYAALRGDLSAHVNGLIPSLRFEDEAFGRSGQIIANEATSILESVVHQTTVRGDVAGQGFRYEDVGVDGFEVEFIREDDALERTETLWPGVCIRTADGHDTFAVQQQFIPFKQYFRERAVSDKLREVGVEDAVQFAFKINL